MSALPFFFQTVEFINRNSNQSVLHFHVDDYSIYFSAAEKKLISLHKSPFGSFVIPNEINHQQINLLIDQVLAYAKTNRFESIEVKCYPEIYSPEKSSFINQALLNANFLLKYKDITQILSCNQKLNLDPSRKRRIDQCGKQGFVFCELSKEHLPEAYDLFLQSRENKGYPITMQLSDFISEFNKFPDRYKLCGVKDKDRLIAASVVISVNEEMLYYFFAGDDLSYRKISPSTFLIYNLFEQATKNGYQLIDLGISTDNGILNKGLYDFKKSFGAVDSQKLTYEKTL